jgi:hypothetical protein
LGVSGDVVGRAVNALPAVVGTIEEHPAQLR